MSPDRLRCKTFFISPLVFFLLSPSHGVLFFVVKGAILVIYCSFLCFVKNFDLEAGKSPMQ